MLQLVSTCQEGLTVFASTITDGKCTSVCFEIAVSTFHFVHDS